MDEEIIGLEQEADEAVEAYLNAIENGAPFSPQNLWEINNRTGQLYNAWLNGHPPFDVGAASQRTEAGDETEEGE